ncbi:MAG: MATE family efflux transporter [Ignavibacteriales bacterium]|nr:MATE family efflux transporter [Ignavibacteriales bacterium]
MFFSLNKILSKNILHIALPAIAGLSSQMIVSLVNTSMVGRLENTHVQLAAMGLGFLGTMAITSFFSSMSTGTHVLIARKHGENNPQGVGEVLISSLFLCFILGTIFGVIGFYSSYSIINFFSANDSVTAAGAEYMRWQFVGLPFFLMIVSYRGFFFGIGHTKIFMISAILINLFNIIFNYLLMFGALGFPKLNLAGAGVGYTLSMFLGWLFFFSVTFLREYRKQYRYYSHFRISKEVINQIIKISIPVSLQNILILLGFLVFVAIVGIIGTVEQAASNVVINALFLSIMPCFGFGIAAQTLVGQSIGKGSNRMAHAYGFETAKLGTYFTVTIGIIFVLFPRAVLHVLTGESIVIEMATPILQIAGVAQIFYGSGIIFASALQAGGATIYVMFVEVLTHWIIFLPLTYLFGITFGGGAAGAWLALPIYIIAYTLMNYFKFRSDSWIQIRL